MSHRRQSLLAFTCLALLLPGTSTAQSHEPVNAARREQEELLTLTCKFQKLVERVHEECVREASRQELITWAFEGLYQGPDGKMPLALRERLDRIKEVEPEEFAALLRDARASRGSNSADDREQDLQRAVKYMLRQLDPHADFVDPSRFRINCFGPTEGIGVRLRLDPSQQWPQVVTPIKDGPAYKAGIKAGDIITGISRDQEMLLTCNLPLESVTRLLLGKTDEKVQLLIRREGERKPLEFGIARGRVEVETVLGFRRHPDDSWDYWLDAENRIAYVRLTQFSRHTARDLTHVLNVLTREKLSGLVLDVRSNPGGLLKSAVEVADLFIDDQVITTIRTRSGPPDVYQGKKEGSHRDFPMVCLINGDSASSSEIVAACLQDHRRALLVGERSRGKGSVQTIQPFDGYEVTLTIAVFLRPSGRKLDRIRLAGRDEEEWGVTPDHGHELKLPTVERTALVGHLENLDIIPRRDRPPKDNAAFQDRQRDLAVRYLRTPIRKS